MAVTDEELRRLHAEHDGSPTKIAKATGYSIRATVNRLRRLGFPPQVAPQVLRKQQMHALYGAHGRIDLDFQHGTILVFSDAHYQPGMVSTAHRGLIALCKRLKPSAIICNGDAFDGGTISRFPRIGWDSKPTVAQELQSVKERLGEIEAVARGAKLLWPLGNHDARYETFLAASAPQYEGVPGFSLKDHFPLWKPCWGVWINDGQCVIKHRYRSGIHASHNNTVNAGTTIVTGHLHSLKVTPFSDFNGTRWGVDTGTLSDPYGPQFADYTELNPVNWRSGFVVLTWRDGELLWPELCAVRREGVIEFRGELIEV